MPTQTNTRTEQVFLFETFIIYVKRRLVTDRNRPLQIGSRALDILFVLLESAGEVVSKEEIIARVWPRTVVEEINLRVNIAAIRRALDVDRDGQSCITNIPQRGYSFVADVRRMDASGVKESACAGCALSNLPVCLTQIEGRDSIVGTLLVQLPMRRFITLVGPGGVGKTCVALQVAQRLHGQYRDGVCFIDFTELASPWDVPGKVAQALGPVIDGLDAVSPAADVLRERQMLLVFDNCEHVIDACALVAEELLRAAPEVSILATSRESLRAEGEYVQHLAPLACPPASVNPDLREAMTYPALRLFVDRVMARQGSFRLRQQDVKTVGQICRRLDGLPLALELAAAKVEVLGLVGFLGQLDSVYPLLLQGRRTAAARHQTLKAMLDWSYALLPQVEKVCLRRLGVFNRSFDMDDAVALISCDTIGETCVFTAIERLVTKSLLCAETSGGTGRYHLLHVTRAYALEKLKSSGEFVRLRDRLARQSGRQYEATI
jgi:predicted ATPase/DNA-binding winged helix-turn-helix (wHTH) protein